MNKKNAQGSLEYLLIIGGVLLIAVIVITLILGIGSSNKEEVDEKQKAMSEFVDNTIVPPKINGVDCNKDHVTIYSSGSPTPGVSKYFAYINEEKKDLTNNLDSKGTLEYHNNSEFSSIDTINVKVVAKKNNQAISRTTTGFLCNIN